TPTLPPRSGSIALGGVPTSRTEPGAAPRRQMLRRALEAMLLHRRSGDHRPRHGLAARESGTLPMTTGGGDRGGREAPPGEPAEEPLPLPSVERLEAPPPEPAL